MKNERFLVEAENLKGYRDPNAQELKAVTVYMDNKINKTLQNRDIIKNVCVVMMCMFMVGSISRFIGLSLGEGVVMLALSILMLVYIVGSNKARGELKALLTDVKKGQFQVLDCFVYKVDMAADINSGAIVYIVNRSGEKCKTRFVVDEMSATESITNSKLPFLLMRVYMGKRYYYELFSERKLRGKR